MSTSPILQAALDYASRGYPVIPVWSVVDGHCACPKGAACDKSPGKHPLGALVPRWREQATTNTDTITSWFTRYPNANLGLVTGEPFGTVIDVDPRNGGFFSLDELKDRYGVEWLDTPTVNTGSGGLHILLQHDPDTLGGELCGFPGIDVKDTGGYIVAAPSLHTSGSSYSWKLPLTFEVQPQPEWLKELRRKKAAPVVAVELDLEEINESHPLDERIRRATGDMKHWPACPEEGRGSRDAVLKHSWRLTRDFALPLDEAEKLLVPWVQKHQPAFEVAWIVSVLKESSGYGKTPVGAALQRDRTASEEIKAHNLSPATGEENLDHTEARFAEALAERLRGRLVWCPRDRAWLRWTGQVWKSCGEEFVAALVADALDDTAREFVAETDKERKKELAKLLAKFSSVAKREAVARYMKVAAVRLGMVVDPQSFDAQPDTINTPAGIISLATGEVGPHDPGAFHTKITAVTPNATPGPWTAFLDRVLPDSAVRQYVQAAAGMSILGHHTLDKLFIIHGPGGTGKSTFANAIAGALGQDYSGQLDFASLRKATDKKSGSAAQPDLAKLENTRFVAVREPNDGEEFDAGLVKALSSIDPVEVRDNYGKKDSYRQINRAAYFWIHTNHLPKWDATDSGVTRRIIPVPFEVKLAATEGDIALRAEAVSPAARPEVLAWLLEGAKSHLKNPTLISPEAINAAAQDYTDKMDPLGRWYRERTVRDLKARTILTELQADLDEWSLEHGIPSPSGLRNRLLKSHTIRREQDGEFKLTKVYGLSLKPSD